MALPALQSRSFCLFEGSSIFSLNGQWITRIVVGWVGWELTGSATWVGLLSFFLFAPTIATSPFFGVLMDRVQLRPAAMVSQGIVAVATLVMFLLYVTGNLTIWSLSVVALVIGIAASGERTARMTIVPRLVDIAILPNAVAIHATNFNTARLIGPAVGGILIERFGTGTAMLVNFILLLPFLVALLFLKVREKEASSAGRQRFMAEFWGGARHAALHPLIREALILTAVTSLTVRGVLEILPAIADGVFHRGAEGLGNMVAAGGAGALAAALINAFRQHRKWGEGIPLRAQLAIILGLLAITTLGVADNWTLAMVLVGICGFCGTMIGINMQATIQLTVDDDFRGRVMSLWMVTGIGTSALGALLLGTFADLIGLTQTLVGSGLIGIVLVVTIRFTHWRAARIVKSGDARTVRAEKTTPS
jgi:MFS family permease